MIMSSICLRLLDVAVLFLCIIDTTTFAASRRDGAGLKRLRVIAKNITKKK